MPVQMNMRKERTLNQLFLLLSQVVRNLVSTFHLSAMNIGVRKLSPPLQHGPQIHLPRPVELTTKQRNSLASPELLSLLSMIRGSLMTSRLLVWKTPLQLYLTRMILEEMRMAQNKPYKSSPKVMKKTTFPLVIFGRMSKFLHLHLWSLKGRELIEASHKPLSQMRTFFSLKIHPHPIWMPGQVLMSLMTSKGMQSVSNLLLPMFLIPLHRLNLSLPRLVFIALEESPWLLRWSLMTRRCPKREDLKA